MNLTVEQIEASYPVQHGGKWVHVSAYWVPICYRDDVLKAYRDAGIPVRIRYRGPRTPSVGREMTYRGHTYCRTRNRAMQDCLRADATHFTVYVR